MTRMLLGNIAAGTSEEEVRDFLQKYGFPAFTRSEAVPGNGTRPGMLLFFDGVDAQVLRKRKERIHDMFWKGGHLTALILSDGFA